jgi:integrase
MLKENVCDRVKAPRPEDRDLKPMKKADLELLLAASAKTRLEIPMVVAATSGLRRGELLALRWQDIDFDKMSIFVSASLEDTRLHGVRLKGPKSKSSRRFIPLAPSVTQLLRAHKQEQEDLKKSSGGAYHDLGFVFSNPDGKPWPPNSFTSQFKKLARSVGLTDFRFHDVRHFFATVSLANGHPIKEVQTLLGHANPSVTLSIYARNLEGLGRKAVDELAESLAPTGHPSANVAG